MDANAVRAKQNEDQVLVAIGSVGWLTIAQVASWAWPDSSKHSATNRAAVVLDRLADAGLVMRRKSSSGAWGYLLTNTGAARANDAYEWEVFRAGYDLSLLDTYRQDLIVAYLLDQVEEVKLGPAGVRGGIRSNLVDVATLASADALTWSPDLCAWRAALVVRTLHPETLAKARRLAAAGHLQLLGPAYLVQQFEKAMH